MSDTYPLSIIVCTYNREKYLSRCLDGLAKQNNIDPQSFEILLIDNKSTDNTKTICNNFISQNKTLNIRYIFEETPGLSNARNRGWNEAKGTFVAYIDDDAIPATEWTQEALSLINRHKNKNLGAFGGPVVRYAEVPLPNWVPDDYGNFDAGLTEKPITSLFGCNMVIKKSLLEQFGGFNPNLGMHGKKIAYGEEDEIFIKMLNANIPILYSPGIKVQHLLRDYQLKMIWRLKSRFLMRMTKVLQPEVKGIKSTTLQKIADEFSIKRLFSNKPMEEKTYHILLGFMIISGTLHGHILKFFRKAS